MKNHEVYYQKRAAEYERVYHKPERQDDLRRIEHFLSQQFIAQDIIEIGCGTGFWTPKLARNCKSILAIDINQEVINHARNKDYPKGNVRFQVIDLLKLSNPPVKYDGLFGGFIWSHVKKEDIPAFLNVCLQQVQPGGELIFIDNKFVEGSSTPISRIDEKGNQYQLRKLQSGEEFEVVKNFPSQLEFAEMINSIGEKLQWVELEYYWIAKI